MAKKTKISDAQARENSLRQPSKSFIRTWCAALRSGKYKQGTVYLYADKKYCCIGVGCIVAGADKKQILGQNYPDGDFDFIRAIDYDFMNHGYSLSALNDDEQFTFDEIADLLELVYIHEMLGKQTID